MTADLIPFPGHRPTEDDAHDALLRFLSATAGFMVAHGVETPTDLPPRARTALDALARDVVDLLDVLGPVLPGVEVVDGRLTFVVPA